ncbi:MAG TPA: ABC transporter ATP-binding protein [Planctomycetota bacterium]|nr:ABC transporter ATP-binding protein [Planctomycetota bacterium]
MLSFSESGRHRAEPLIQLDGVCKDYSSGPNTVKALRPATLTLDRGEFVLLEGPSGSGKTTLLSIMGLLMKPTGGSIRILGDDVTRLGEDKLPAIRLKHIGFIFQTFNLFPALSALDNVKLILKLKGYSWTERRKEAPHLLERVGLGECMNRKPADLSGGQRQRICIARALAGESDIILADEPTAALDTVTGTAIIELLRDEARTGRKAVLVVTHDLRLEKYATRVDRITDGELNCGTPLRRAVRESGVLREAPAELVNAAM